MKATDFAIVALATWRLCHLLVYEDGPWDVVKLLRFELGVVEQAPVNGPPRRSAETVLGKLLLCPLCLSVWIAPVVGGSWFVRLTRPLIVALAISGASSLLELEVTRK